MEVSLEVKEKQLVNLMEDKKSVEVLLFQKEEELKAINCNALMERETEMDQMKTEYKRQLAVDKQLIIDSMKHEFNQFCEMASMRHNEIIAAKDAEIAGYKTKVDQLNAVVEEAAPRDLMMRTEGAKLLEENKRLIENVNNLTKKLEAKGEVQNDKNLAELQGQFDEFKKETSNLN